MKLRDDFIRFHNSLKWDLELKESELLICGCQVMSSGSMLSSRPKNEPMQRKLEYVPFLERSEGLRFWRSSG